MYVRNHVLLVLFTLVGVSFVANAQQPAGDPAPTVSPAVEPAPAAEPVPAPSAPPLNTDAPAADAPTPAEIAPAAAPVASPETASPETTVTQTQTATERVPRAFHGSTVSYSHSITALTLAPAAEGHYNPTWGHRLGLMPEWHFNDQLFVRGRLYLSQEFTTSDTTTYDHEVEVSDIWLDVGAAGVTEPKTGLHLGGDVRFLLPTSKVSQAQSRIITVGPSLSLSKEFKLLHGLSVAYTGRFTYRFNRFTTSQNKGGLIINSSPLSCVDLPGCNTDSGKYNVNYDFAHGPAIGFKPLEKLSVDAFFSWYHLFLYPQSANPVEFAGAQGLSNKGTDVKNLAVFALSVSYQLTKPVSLTFGTWTVTGQPSPDGTYLQPLFNRNTTLYLDASFDIEAAAASFL